MLKTISPGEFIEATLLMTAIYYAAVFLLFYQREIKNLLRRRQLSPGNGQMLGKATRSIETRKKEPDKGSSAEELLTEKIIEEIRTLIKQSKLDGVDVPDMLLKISGVVSLYTQLEGSLHQTAINNSIILECATVYAVQLQDKDVIGLWGE